MDTIMVTAGVVGVFVAAIMFLTLFFKLLGWFSRRAALRVNPLEVSGVLDEQARINMTLRGGMTIENVRFVGCAGELPLNGRLPYQLSKLLILEHADGRRTLVPPRLLRSIEVLPQG